MRLYFTLIFATITFCAINGQEEAWWSYYPQDAKQAHATGDAVAQTYITAIRLPGGYAMPEDGQLLGIRFKLSTRNVSNMQAWVSTELPESAADASIAIYDVQQTDYDAQKAMYTIRFPQPVDMPAGGAYIGISFTVPTINADAQQAIYDQNPVCYVQEDIAQRDAFYIRSDKFPYWENYGITGKSLVLQVLLGGKLYANAARPADFGTHDAIHGETTMVPVLIRNMGTAAIKSIDYVIDTRSLKGEELHYTLTQPIEQFSQQTTLNLPFASDSYTGNVKKTLRITKVNGQPNETDASATGALFEMTRRVEPKLLFEEFTGTWCVNCPRGMVGLEKLSNDFNGRLVGIAIHNGDPMALSDYDFTMQMIKGYPSALINRKYEVDPYYGITTNEPYAVKDNVAFLLENSKAPAELSVVARWNSDSTTIDITTNTTFLFDSNSANYALGYVLIANGLKGDPTKGWQQKNGYAGNTSITDPNLLPWTDKPEWVSDISYNHVAIGVWGAKNGLVSSVKAPIVAEEAQTHTYRLNIGDNTLVQDKRQLAVAALLFERQSGIVVNVAEASPVSPTESAIASIVTQTRHPYSYDLQGRRIERNAHSKGLRILHDNNGTTRKIFIP